MNNKAKILNIALAVVNIAFLIFFVVSSRAVTHPLTTDVLRVKAFELVDNQGQTRARMNVESGGEVVLRLLDAEGTIRVKLGASENGSGLVLLNENTEPGIHLIAGSTGTRLAITRQDGQEQVLEP